MSASTIANIFYICSSFNECGSNEANKNSEKSIDYVSLKSNLSKIYFANSLP